MASNLSSTQNVSTLSPLEKSFVNYDIQLPYNVILYIVIVFLMVLSNGGTMLALYKTKEVFRSTNYKLIFNMSLVLVIQAVYICINNGILRIIFTVKRIGDYETGLSCGLRQFPYEITMVVDQINIVVIAFDRLLAVVMPVNYKNLNLSKKYLVLCILFPWVWGFGETIAKFSLYTKEKMSQISLFCVMSTTRTPDFLKYVGIRAMVLASLTLVVYAVTLIVCKLKLVMCAGSVTTLRSQLGLRLMKTCLIDGVIYAGTYFVSQVYLNIVITYASGDALIVLGPLAITFQLMATVPRFFVNLYFNTEIRNWLKKKFTLRKTTKVTNISTPSSQPFDLSRKMLHEQSQL